MNLFFSAILIGVARAALPPGYEDQIWCPPDNCEVYTNPYGFRGAASSFIKCYNPEDDETTDGVWTGSHTDTTAPDGYVKPETCTALEYSQCDTEDDCSLEITPSCNCYVSSSFHPFDPCKGLAPSECNTDQCNGEECYEYEAICSEGNNGEGGTCEILEKPTATDKIPSKCDSTDQCSSKIRSQAASAFTGVGMCDCYAASSIDPFDECEGQEHCAIAGCRSDSCDGLEAYCDIESEGSDIGECTLRYTDDVFEIA